MFGLEKKLFRNMGIFILISISFLFCGYWFPNQRVVYADPENHEVLQNLEDAYRRLAAQTSQYVVEVRVSSSQTVSQNSFFYGLPGESNDDVSEEKSYGIGSGVLVRENHPEYLLITNYHVAGNAENIRVILNDGRKLKAERIGLDSRKDLAVLKIRVNSPEVLNIAEIGNSDLVMKGDWVIVTGSPYEFRSSVSTGIISSKNRIRGPDGNISDFLQTDAAINQGNSGGGLFDIEGKLIGINTWIAAPYGGGNIGLGFSIPSNNIIKTLNDIEKFGEVKYGWIGLSIHLSDILSQFDNYFLDEEILPDKEGVFIDQVFIGYPAEIAGLNPGDTILKVNGKKTVHKKGLSLLVGDSFPGETLEIEYLDSWGNKKQITVTSELRDEDILKSLYGKAWPGIYLIPLTPSLVEIMKLESKIDQGLLVESVIPRSPAQLAGLAEGDIIFEVNGTNVSDYQDFFKELRKSDTIEYSYFRNGNKEVSEKIDLKQLRGKSNE